MQRYATKELPHKIRANANVNVKLTKSRNNTAQLSVEIKQVRDQYADKRKIRLEARKIKANATTVITKEK